MSSSAHLRLSGGQAFQPTLAKETDTWGACLPKIAAHLTDRFAIGILVLDRDGAVLNATRTAQDILRKGGLTLSRRGLIAEDAGQQRDLQALIGREDPGQGQPQWLPRFMAIKRSASRYRLGVVVITLVERPSPGSPSAIVLLRDPENAALTRWRSLSDLFGLTPNQARLCALLLEGLSLNEAVARMGVTRNTGRTHLRHVYARIGVGSKTQLVTKLLNSALPLL